MSKCNDLYTNDVHAHLSLKTIRKIIKMSGENKNKRDGAAAIQPPMAYSFILLLSGLYNTFLFHIPKND